jgi:hypothetical protein
MQTTPSLGYRLFMWGLSNGLITLTVAGTFWWGMTARFTRPALFAPIAVVAAALGYGTAGIRRRALGFRLRDARSEPETFRAARKVAVGFRWVSVAQTALVGVTVWTCVHAHREDLIWPAIALVVSLHFIPIAWLVRVRPYYALAAAGSFVAIAGLLVPGWSREVRDAVVGAGMGLTLWTTAIYVIRRAERLADLWDDLPRRTA